MFARCSLETRITPACAGITQLREIAQDPLEDHPRVCGNYYNQAEGFAGARGSPPRVRELPEASTKSLSFFGITPACAGITCGCHGCGFHGLDHPRVCGNYMGFPPFFLVPLGSPPRVRELLNFV